MRFVRMLSFLLAAALLLLPAPSTARCDASADAHACCDRAASGDAFSSRCGMPDCEMNAGSAPLPVDLASLRGPAPIPAIGLAAAAAPAFLSPRAAVPRPSGAISARAAPELARLSSFRN